MNKLNLIKSKIKEKKIYFTIIFLLYILINIFLNKTYITYNHIIYNHTIFYIIFFILINYIIVPFLVSTTIILSIQKINDLKNISKKGSSISLLAIFATLLGGACPHCFVGLFPAFMGLFSTTITLGNLPLQGFEIQIISSIILLISIYYLSNPTICKIKKN
jgi:Na+/H+-dicarboxylate symporter